MTLPWQGCHFVVFMQMYFHVATMSFHTSVCSNTFPLHKIHQGHRKLGNLALLTWKIGYMIPTSMRMEPSQLDFGFPKCWQFKAVEANTHRHHNTQCWLEVKSQGQITEKFALWFTVTHKLIFAMGLREGAYYCY